MRPRDMDLDPWPGELEPDDGWDPHDDRAESDRVADRAERTYWGTP